MKFQALPLAQIAEINPRLGAALTPDAKVSFVPMSAVSADTARVESPEVRVYSDVSKGYTPFRNGDVLVAKITPCFENGKIAHADLPQPHAFGSTEFHVIRPLPGIADARYLLHFLRLSSVRAEGTRRMTGSAGQRRVPEAFLSELKVPVAPLVEQRRLAAILDQAEALRAQRRAAIAQLDSLGQAIFVEMFGDPVNNHRGWPLVPLGEVGQLDRGISKHRPRNAPELLGGRYPLIQTGDVANCDGYIRSHTATYSELGLKQSKLWPTGTLCITIAANIAKTGVLTFDACFPDSVVAFVAKETATVEYVRVWLSFLQKALEDSAPESAQKNINLAILRNLRVPLPPKSVQQDFAQRIRAVEALKRAYVQGLGQTEKLFASLQHRAFRGELTRRTSTLEDLQKLETEAGLKP